MNTAIEQYIHELSGLLCCDKATKQQFLLRFQQTLEDFEAGQETVPLSYSDLISEFGTPQVTADAFLSQLDVSQVQPVIRTNRKKKNLLGLTLYYSHLILNWSVIISYLFE